MNIASSIGLLICLLFIFFQDWKHRQIHIVLPFLIFTFSFFSISHDSKFLTEIIIYNSLFFVIVVSVLTIYMSLKSKRFLNPFQNYFGLGDFLFYIAITPLFLIQKYVLFFILSMVFAIVLQLGLKKFIKENTVPLAGFSALFLFFVVIKDLVFHFQKFTLL